MQDFAGKRVRVLVVWEPVLPTDWGPPSSAGLNRIADARGIQFWDHDRLVSRLLGERDRRSIVWDHVAVYPAGAIWNQQSPQPLYEGGPVVKVMGPLRDALRKALQDRQNDFNNP